MTDTAPPQDGTDRARGFAAPGPAAPTDEGAGGEHGDSELRPRGRLYLFLPLIVFAALAGVFLVQLFAPGDPHDVPSALIGQAAPATDLPPLDGLTANGAPVPTFSNADFPGHVTLVNVWASWCAPCREEHPVLMQLASDERIRIVGLNHQDDPANALRFLGGLGNPFDAVGVDTSGRTSIDWGVYGVPETFLVGPDGTILYKYVGPLTQTVVANTLMPRVEEALARL